MFSCKSSTIDLAIMQQMLFAILNIVLQVRDQKDFAQVCFIGVVQDPVPFVCLVPRESKLSNDNRSGTRCKYSKFLILDAPGDAISYIYSIKSN